MDDKEKELYHFWKSKFRTHFLRAVCWDVIRPIIIENEVSSVLEFGCGLSTLLFDSLGLKVTSYDTEQRFIDFVKQHCSSNVELILWENEGDPVTSQYDFSLVDGVLPRTPQLKVAVCHSNLIAIDDFRGKLTPILTPELKGFERIDSEKTKIAVFARRN